MKIIKEFPGHVLQIFLKIPISFILTLKHGRVFGEVELVFSHLLEEDLEDHFAPPKNKRPDLDSWLELLIMDK